MADVNANALPSSFTGRFRDGDAGVAIHLRGDAQRQPDRSTAINTPITLTASATGGYQVQYLFRAGYTDSAGWHWTNLKARYSTTASCSLDAHRSRVPIRWWCGRAWRGIPPIMIHMRCCTYQITAPPLTAVALAAIRPSPQAVNTPITLDRHRPPAAAGRCNTCSAPATPIARAGTGRSQYRLYHHRPCTWTPATAGSLYAGGLGAPGRAYRQL